MQFKIIFLSFILIFNFNLSAAERDSTIEENFVELKQAINQANGHNPKKFNELLTIIYDDLAAKIYEIEEQMGEQKTALTIKMHEELQGIQKDIVAYKQATKKKAKGLRLYIVNKLEQLLKQIKAHKKSNK